MSTTGQGVINTASDIATAGGQLLSGAPGIATGAMISATFWVLIIFLAMWLVFTFGLWGKLTTIVESSSFASHMDSGSTINTQSNAALNQFAMQSAPLTSYSFNGFANKKGHLANTGGNTRPGIAFGSNVGVSQATLPTGTASFQQILQGAN